jgi:hypothetical protein
MRQLETVARLELHSMGFLAGHAQPVVSLTYKCSLEDTQGSMAWRHFHANCMAWRLSSSSSRQRPRLILLAQVTHKSAKSQRRKLFRPRAKPNINGYGWASAQLVTSRVSDGTRVVQQVVLASVRPFHCGFPHQLYETLRTWKQRTCASVRPELKHEQPRWITNPQRARKSSGSLAPVRADKVGAS